MMFQLLKVCLTVPAVSAVFLRRFNTDPTTPTEIHEKWDKMDDFLETMFVMACKWKHGKDVNGLAGEKLKNGDIEPHELSDFKAKTQDENVEGVMRACGMIVAKGKKKCRESCADRLGTMDSKVMKERANCDKTCVSRYAQFEKSCQSKADNLKSVYGMKLKMAAAKKACYEDHCRRVPTVWMMSKDEQGAEVDTQCKKACTEDRVKVGCERKFALEIDFSMAKVESTCQSESEVTTCFGTKKSELSSTADTCNSNGKSDCGGGFDKCKTDGKVMDTHKNAEEFCSERKKMCLEQVDETCLSKHEKALQGAKKTCEDEDADRQKSCVSEKAKAMEKTEVGACVTKKKPTCDEDCHASCDTGKMNKCLDNLGSTTEVTEEFCTDFWHLLHESSEVDPETGNPIALLSSHSVGH